MGDQPGFSYHIYTVERLPKGYKRKPRWDLHSMAQSKKEALSLASVLERQPHFGHVFIKEFIHHGVKGEAFVRDLPLRPVISMPILLCACVVVSGFAFLFFG